MHKCPQCKEPCQCDGEAEEMPLTDVCWCPCEDPDPEEEERLLLEGDPNAKPPKGIIHAKGKPIGSPVKWGQFGA